MNIGTSFLCFFREMIFPPHSFVVRNEGFLLVERQKSLYVYGLV